MFAIAESGFKTGNFPLWQIPHCAGSPLARKKEDDAMARTMTPSAAKRTAMTDGQIEKAVGIFRSAIRKKRQELDSEAVQKALGTKDFSQDLFRVFRRRVETVSSLVTRHFYVEYSLSLSQIIEMAIGVFRLSGEMVEGPIGSWGLKKITFFCPKRFIGDEELEKEYELHDLNPLDPCSLFAFNKGDISFHEEYSNTTHWKDSMGRWCYITFSSYNGHPNIHVGYHNKFSKPERMDGWGSGWWFAGVPK